MDVKWRAVATDANSFARYAVTRFLNDGGLSMAASLTYTTLLSLVPMMTVAFGMLAIFPVFQDMKANLENTVLSNLLPGPAMVVRQYLDTFIENTGKLTAAGTIGLCVTSVLTLLTVESTLNTIFRVRQQGELVYRLLVFWALLTLGPLFMGLSLSLSTYVYGLAEGAGFGAVIRNSVVGYVVPAAITTALLCFFYIIIPNRNVGFVPPLIGAAIAALLFGFLRFGFAIYITRFPTYQAIYGAVSVVPIFLVWIFCSWTVVLFGAVVAAALSDWLRAGGPPSRAEFPGDRKLAIALAILRCLFLQSREGGGIGHGRLVVATGLAESVLDQALEGLQRHRYVVRTSEGLWALARDLQAVSLYDLFADLGLAIEATTLPEGGGWESRLAERLQELRRQQKAAGAVSVRALIAESERNESQVVEPHDQSIPSRSRRTS